jgi:hypothetical protein
MILYNVAGGLTAGNATTLFTMAAGGAVHLDARF